MEDPFSQTPVPLISTFANASVRSMPFVKTPSQPKKPIHCNNLQQNIQAALKIGFESEYGLLTS